MGAGDAGGISVKRGDQREGRVEHSSDSEEREGTVGTAAGRTHKER